MGTEELKMIIECLNGLGEMSMWGLLGYFTYKILTIIVIWGCLSVFFFTILKITTPYVLSLTKASRLCQMIHTKLGGHGELRLDREWMVVEHFIRRSLDRKGSDEPLG